MKGDLLAVWGPRGINIFCRVVGNSKRLFTTDNFDIKIEASTPVGGVAIPRKRDLRAIRGKAGIQLRDLAKR